jgi:RsiW-degrading membrane proteinase PrsW (M82 family)
MIVLGIILGLLPGFAWLFFYLEEDVHPEPKRLIALTFVVGAAAAFLALAVEIFFNTAIRSISAEKLTFSYLLVLGLIEEFIKFGAAYITVHKNPAFDEPVDAMIYMVVASLGFATVENLGAINSNPAQTALLGTVFATTSFRFIGATLLHSLTSALLGYYWAIGIRKMNAAKYIVIGLAVATVLHGIFNYLIMNYGNALYSVVFLLVVGFFVLADFEQLKRRPI